MGKNGRKNGRKGGGNKCLQVGGKINFQTIYKWIVRMISILFYGTENRYRWRSSRQDHQ